MSTSPAGRGDRNAFLERVRARIGEGLPENPLRPVVADATPEPIAYAVDVGDPVAAFTTALTGLGGTVDTVDERDRYLRRVIEQRDVQRAVVSRDSECDGVVEVLRAAGVEVAPLGDVAAAARADIGITGAACGFALTGSIVVDSTRAGARAASLLPPVHLVLLSENRLLKHAGVFLRGLGERDRVPMPSNLVVITGPSKSADIELILTVGVHGPRELIVGLLPGQAGSDTSRV